MRYFVLCFLFLFSFQKALQSQVFTKVTDPSNPIISSPNLGGNYKGASWVDVNNDNLLDLFVCGSQIFKNLGNGNFETITNSMPTNMGAVIGNSWSDFDNDGDIDFYITSTQQTAARTGLYVNDGNGVFTKIYTGTIGDSASNTGWGCAWGDYNNDTYTDLIIVVAGTAGGANHPTRLFLNNGNGTFNRVDTTIVTSFFPVAYTIPVWSDYDQDGDIDLFIGSGPVTGTPSRDYIYRNYKNELNVPFYFSRIDTGALGTSLQDGQNYNLIDYDNDGDLDAFVTCYAANIPNVLFRCDGLRHYNRMTLADVGDIVTYHPGNALSNTWGDFDNDSYIDCIVTYDGNTRTQYFHNNGNGTFTRNDSISLMLGGGPHMGATVGDYDNNGLLDLYLATGLTDARGLYKNTTQNSNKWINLNCVGMGPATGMTNKSALGTIVKVKAVINGNSVWQMREINAQNSFNSMNALNVHFGLGNATVIDSMIIKWGGGLTQVFTNVQPNKFYKAVEGQGLNEVFIGINQVSTEIPAKFSLGQNYPNPFNPVTKIKFEVSSASNIKITLFDITGRFVSVIADSFMQAGTYEARFDGSKLASGTYFYKLEAEEFTETKKMILVK